jgi:hypothetical protein
MLKRSRVFRCVPLFCSCNICNMLWMGPTECLWFTGCLAKFEERLAVLNDVLCSRNRVAKPSLFVPHMLFHSQGT